MKAEWDEPIGSTKAFRWLSEMQGWEQNRFMQYLRSEFFQTRSTVQATAQALVDSLGNPEASKPEVFARAFPGRDYDHQVFHQHLNHLMEAMKHFVAVHHAIKEMEDRPDLMRVNYFKGIKSLARNSQLHTRSQMWAEYLSQHERLQKRLVQSYQPELLADLENHFCETYSEENPQGGPAARGRKPITSPREVLTLRKIAAIDKASYVVRLRESCIMVSSRSLRGSEYSPIWTLQLRRLRALIASNSYTRMALKDPQVRFYEEFLSLMEATYAKFQGQEGKVLFDPGDAAALCQIAKENPEIFMEDRYSSGIYANVLVNLVNQGFDDFSANYFEIQFKLMLHGRMVDFNGKIPATTFRNIVLLGYRLGGQYAISSDQLVKQFRSKLSCVYRERANLLEMCAAWKLFYLKEYHVAYQRAAGLQFQDPLFQIQLKDLVFKSAFSAELDVSRRGRKETDFYQPLEEMRALVLRFGRSGLAIVSGTKTKIPLYSMLVEAVDAKLTKKKLQDLRDRFGAALAHASLPNHEKSWLIEMMREF